MSENGENNALATSDNGHMTLDEETCHRALAARDPRFDGLFFVGISSTGIYCRCVCSARTARRENRTFFSNAASAEQAGYRPCLLCRPELAPGKSRVDAVGRLATAVVRRIEDGALMDTSITELAEELGVTDRHLRRAVSEHYGVSPIELIQTQRLLTAKRLLMDTNLPIGVVAVTAGFASLRRFNALFKERYRLNPTEIRRSRVTPRDESVALEVGYRPPYDWESIAAFLRSRAIFGVESVTEELVYRRTVSAGKHSGWIEVTPSKTRHALRVKVSAGLTRAIPQILRRVRRLFDTASEPSAIAEALGDLAKDRPGLRVPGAFDGFEAACRAVIGQQISVAGARTILSRVVERFGTRVDTEIQELTRAFPSADTIASATVDEIASLGIVGKRAQALVAVAQAVVSKEIRLVPGSDLDETVARLCQIPGIGEWTGQYIAMRALSYPDAFPHSDLGILKALGTNKPSDALQTAEQWRPWRAYAALHLWRSLTP